MEVKNGIIIEGVLHELDENLVMKCEECSMNQYCSSDDICMTIYNSCGTFINRGKVTNIEIEEAENESKVF